VSELKKKHARNQSVSSLIKEEEENSPPKIKLNYDIKPIVENYYPSKLFKDYPTTQV